MIFIAGATGFVGSNLLEWVKGTDISVRILVRSEQKGITLKAGNPRLEYHIGDITDRDSLKNALEGVSIVVHLVGIMEGRPDDFKTIHVNGTENLINEAIRSGIKTLFYQSALGASLNGDTPYEKTKAIAEDLVISSGIPYIIFRPSLIIGKTVTSPSTYDGFTRRLIDLIKGLPVIPIPGEGKARFQPLYIKDWIRAFEKAVLEREDQNRIFELSGPEWLTYNQIIETMMDVMKIKKQIIHLPIWALKTSLPLARPLQNLFKGIPIPTLDQLRLLQKDNITDPQSIKKDFGFEPISYKEALLLILNN